MLELTNKDLSLIRAIVANYVSSSKDNKPHSGVDQLLMGGVIIECRKLVDAIDKELEQSQQVVAPRLSVVEG